MKRYLALLLVGVLALTGCSSGSTTKASSTDGSYSATGKGYGGDVTVTLEVKDNKISNVTIVGDKETENVGSKAVAQMPDTILKAQSYEVDGVSGATITSTTIKKLTQEAMTKAGLLESSTDTGCNASGELDLAAINEYLNTNADMGPGTVANAVAIIPINHINGPRDEHQFYAFVNYKYVSRAFIRYQVTYLSCTCRSADVNYWMTAYVELTLPTSGDINDSTIRSLSYDYDHDGHYLAGFWGDSNPTPAGATYEQFKEQYIPFFIGKNYKYIRTLNVVEDIDPQLYAEGDGRENLTLDTFSGSSVSSNNIIRMLLALYDYHATDEFFQS